MCKRVRTTRNDPEHQLGERPTGCRSAGVEVRQPRARRPEHREGGSGLRCWGDGDQEPHPEPASLYGNSGIKQAPQSHGTTTGGGSGSGSRASQKSPTGLQEGCLQRPGQGRPGSRAPRAQCTPDPQHRADQQCAGCTGAPGRRHPSGKQTRLSQGPSHGTDSHPPGGFSCWASVGQTSVRAAMGVAGPRTRTQPAPPQWATAIPTGSKRPWHPCRRPAGRQLCSPQANVHGEILSCVLTDLSPGVFNVTSHKHSAFAVVSLGAQTRGQGSPGHASFHSPRNTRIT